MLVIEGLEKTYPNGVQALAGVDLNRPAQRCQRHIVEIILERIFAGVADRLHRVKDPRYDCGEGDSQPDHAVQRRVRAG